MRADLITFAIEVAELAIRDTRAELFAARRAYHTERQTMLEQRIAQQKADLAQLRAGQIPETMRAAFGAPRAA